ncbi:hypothetical protein F5X98DRAFT_387871 [Xylaria grammica]|nr:hypothetical protein F5X98DRAFT_387871 [Xylaria grammica]
MQAPDPPDPYSAIYIPLQLQVDNPDYDGGGEDVEGVPREVYNDGIFLQFHPGFRGTGAGARAGAGAGDNPNNNNDDGDDQAPLHIVLGPNRTTYLAGQGIDDGDKLAHLWDARYPRRRGNRGANRPPPSLWDWASDFFSLGAYLVLIIASLQILFSIIRLAPNMPLMPLRHAHRYAHHMPFSFSTTTTTTTETMVTATPVTPYESQAHEGESAMAREQYGPPYATFASHVLLRRLTTAFVDDCLTPVMALLDKLGVNVRPTYAIPFEIDGWSSWMEWFVTIPRKPSSIEHSDIERFCPRLQNAAAAPGTQTKAQAAPSRDLLLRACNALPDYKRRLRSWADMTNQSLSSLDLGLKWIQQELERMQGADKLHYASLVVEQNYGRNRPRGSDGSGPRPYPEDEEMRLRLPSQKYVNALVWAHLRTELCEERVLEFEDDDGRSFERRAWVSTLRAYADDLVKLRNDLARLWGAILLARTEARAEAGAGQEGQGHGKGKEEPFLAVLRTLVEAEESGIEVLLTEPFLAALRAELEAEEPRGPGRAPQFRRRALAWLRRSLAGVVELLREWVETITRPEVERLRKQRRSRILFSLSTLDAAIEETRAAADDLDDYCRELKVLHANQWHLGLALDEIYRDRGEHEEGRKAIREFDLVVIWTPWHVERLREICKEAAAALGQLVKKGERG